MNEYIGPRIEGITYPVVINATNTVGINPLNMATVAIPYPNQFYLSNGTGYIATNPKTQDQDDSHMRRFTFKFGYQWSGIVFEDGYVCIRGKIIGRGVETHQYNNLEEMLLELCLQADDLHWIDGETAE